MTKHLNFTHILLFSVEFCSVIISLSEAVSEEGGMLHHTGRYAPFVWC